MITDERGALKDIICYSIRCCDCAFSDGCNWEEATDEKLIFLAQKAIKNANPANKKMLLDYAKNTGVIKYLALKAQIV